MFIIWIIVLTITACNTNQNLKQADSEKAIKKFIENEGEINGIKYLTADKIISVEPVAQFTDKVASVLVHFKNALYNLSDIILKFNFKKDVHKEWFLTSMQPIRNCSESIVNWTRFYKEININVSNLDAYVKYRDTTNLIKTTYDDITEDPNYTLGLSLVTKSDCSTCHKITEILIGPSYQQIANKYANNEDAVDYLANRIINGSLGNWGDIEMTNHPNLSKDDAKQMIKYILLFQSR